MFENSKVKAAGMMMAQVIPDVEVELGDVLALGGLSITASLDTTVKISERPINGKWNSQMTMMDENGQIQRQMVQTVLNAGVPPDLVVVHVLFSLSLAGGFQLETKNGEILPKQIALSAKDDWDEKDWESFIEKWKMCVVQLFFKSRNMLPSLPANNASNNVNSSELAEDIWPQLVEEFPELIEAVLQSD